MDHSELLGPPPDGGEHEDLLGPPPSRADANTPAGQKPVYPAQDEISKPAAAWQATKDAYNAPIPGQIWKGGPSLLEAKQRIEEGSNLIGRGMAAMGQPSMGSDFAMTGRMAAGMIPGRMKDALWLAAIGPIIEGAGVAGKAALATDAGQAVAGAAKTAVKGGGQLLADVAGVFAGKDSEVLKVLANKPGAIWKKASELFSIAHQENVEKTLQEGMGKVGEKFGALEDQLAGYQGTPTQGMAPKVNLKKVFDSTIDAMQKSGHRIPEDISGVAPKITVGRIASDSPEYGEIVGHLKTLKENPELDFGQALNLRRQVDATIDFAAKERNGLSPAADKVLGDVRTKINDALRESLPKDIQPKWDEVNKTFSEARENFNGLWKQIVKTSPQQTENKLLQLIKEGRYDDEVTSRAQAIGGKVLKVFDDARDHIAARSMKKWAESPNAAHLLGGLPRPVGMAASGVGAAAQAAPKIAGAAAANPQASLIGARAIQGGMGGQ